MAAAAAGGALGYAGRPTFFSHDGGWKNDSATPVHNPRMRGGFGNLSMQGYAKYLRDDGGS